jgi:hypothetical protein
MTPVAGYRMLYNWKTQTGEVDVFTEVGKFIKIATNSLQEFTAVATLLGGGRISVDPATETLVRTG